MTPPALQGYSILPEEELKKRKKRSSLEKLAALNQVENFLRFLNAP